MIYRVTPARAQYFGRKFSYCYTVLVSDCNIKQSNDVLVALPSLWQRTDNVNLDIGKKFTNNRNFRKISRRNERTGPTRHLAHMARLNKLGYMRFNFRLLQIFQKANVSIPNI